jgi:hypothetical protein
MTPEVTEQAWGFLFSPEATFNTFVMLAQLCAPMLAGVLIYSHMGRAARLLAKAKEPPRGG